MFLSKHAECDSKKLKFIKQQEGSGLLSSLGIKTPLNKIPLVGPLLFRGNTRDKMNDTNNTFLLAGGKFMSEMHLRQPGFT